MKSELVINLVVSVITTLGTVIGTGVVITKIFKSEITTKFEHLKNLIIRVEERVNRIETQIDKVFFNNPQPHNKVRTERKGDKASKLIYS